MEFQKILNEGLNSQIQSAAYRTSNAYDQVTKEKTGLNTGTRRDESSKKPVDKHELIINTLGQISADDFDT